MAIVRSIQPGKQRIKAHSTEVDCHFAVVTEDSGEKLLHLTTFGSDSRKSAPKSSQSLQINSVIAGQLMQLLADTFPETKN